MKLVSPTASEITVVGNTCRYCDGRNIPRTTWQIKLTCDPLGVNVKSEDKCDSGWMILLFKYRSHWTLNNI